MRVNTLLSFLGAVLLGVKNAEAAALMVQDVSALAPSSDKWDYANCGFDTDPVEIKDISLSPDPPEPGKELVVTVIGTAKERVDEGAYAQVTVKLGLVKLLSKQFDICEEARKGNASIQCPIEKDTYTVVQSVQLPKEIPRAKYVIQVEGYTKDDDNLMCLKISLNLMNRPFFVR